MAHEAMRSSVARIRCARRHPTRSCDGALTCLQVEALAKKILLTGTLSGVEGGKSAATVDAMIEKLSSSDTYKSHGAVIDFEEAREIGLPVEWMPPQDTLWKRIWLLYCCYEHDARLKGLGKIIEGAQNSISRSLPRVG